ncbi:hypothetical protein AMTR_s00062p00072500 [Amborella trichopoda]|uniref:Aminotransferase-like plant mobile domain-containing protein n=1 Tax=Amborella trichopoda TaxID=13333 RepID=U5D1S4_AMBTC|nr:hypothetical protein AMTR_s00062p00072500 [Amborella trichopoda]
MSSLFDLHKFIEDNLGIVTTTGNLTTTKHSWLKANFRGLPPDASPVKIVRYTRAYQLFLISVTIFADALVAIVLIRYLQLFEDIEQASRYAWGTAALAYLYRLLRKACTFKQRCFSGYAALMQVIWNPYFNPDEAISDDRHEAFQTAMAFEEILYLLIRGPPDMVGKEYKTWYSRVSHPIIHNVANPPIDILQPRYQEEEEVVFAHEPQYIMRHRGYEDQLVSAVQTSTTIFVEVLTLRQKWYPEVYNGINNVFEMLSKFVPVDLEDIDSRMEMLQREVNDEAVQEEGGQDVVGESSRVVAEDLAPSTQPAVEQRRRHNTRQKQYPPKRRRHP